MQSTNKKENLDSKIPAKPRTYRFRTSTKQNGIAVAKPNQVSKTNGATFLFLLLMKF
jgi:hypothetical protein